MATQKGYAGRIGNGAAQKVTAVFPSEKKKTGAVKTGGDLRGGAGQKTKKTGDK